MNIEELQSLQERVKKLEKSIVEKYCIYINFSKNIKYNINMCNSWVYFCI